MSKSPLTGILGESSSGGFWGRELRKAGYEHIIIEGKSDSAVYLWIKDDEIEIRDATHLWGKGNYEVNGLIKNELGDKMIRVASIGIAGENLVRYASIMNERDRAAGRCGLGAVMGSKKLKAVAVRGTRKIPVVDEDALKKAAKKLNDMVTDHPLITVHKDYGTTLGMDNGPHYGDVPIKNYTKSRWVKTKKIGGIALFERKIRTSACYNCPVGCAKEIFYQNEWIRSPEYESLAMLGSNLLVGDLDAIIRWNYLANDMGMDVISLGATMAMFFETLERGLLKQDLKDPILEKAISNKKYWGLINAITHLIDIIAKKKGIGKDLAEGVKRFVKMKNLPADLSTEVKGLEVPAHEPRCNNLTALDYVTTPRGAFHCYLPMDLSTAMHVKKELGLGEIVERHLNDPIVVESLIKVQDASEAYSACGGCIFGYKWLPEITPWIEALNAITGRNYNVKTWVEVGERNFNMKRKYNMECGITKADDKLGARFYTPIPKGATMKNVPPIEDLLPIYYEKRGWDEEGKPTFF